jgi:hypothetical protein
MGTFTRDQTPLERARRAWVRAGEAYLVNPADPALARAEADARRVYDAVLRDRETRWESPTRAQAGVPDRAA